jgi:hypothetical protein
MRGLIKFAWMPLVAMSIYGGPLNISTGNTSGATFVGGGWLVNNAAAVTLGATGLPLLATFPTFGWIGNAGEWIGPGANSGGYLNQGVCSTGLAVATCGELPGAYTYTLTWTSTFGGSFSIAGFTGDNGVKNGSPVNTSFQVLVNSVSVFNSSSASHSNMEACVPSGNPAPGQCSNSNVTGTISNGSGVITYSAGQTIQLRALVVNDGLSSTDTTTRTPSGFILRGTGMENEVPEPSTYAMLGIGGAALLFARLRRK